MADIGCLLNLDRCIEMSLNQRIWSMEGALFWKAFIFETPFVLLRLLPVFMAVFFCISFYKAYRKYSMLKRNSATGLLSQGDGGQ